MVRLLNREPGEPTFTHEQAVEVYLARLEGSQFIV
jgi:hypothetical protein